MDPNLQILWDFITKWAYAPATTVIVFILWALKSKTFLPQITIDWGKFQWVLAPICGLIFGVGQKYLAVPLGYTPIHTEFWPIVFMSMATGLSAVVTHTIGKNTWEGVKEWWANKKAGQ